MPTWVRIMAITLVLIMFVIPAVVLGLLTSPFFFLLLFGLIFVPVILLQPAVERSRRGG